MTTGCLLLRLYYAAIIPNDVGVGAVVSVAFATSAVLLMLLFYVEIAAAHFVHNNTMHVVSGAASCFPQQPLAIPVLVRLCTTYRFLILQQQYTTFTPLSCAYMYLPDNCIPL